MATLHNPKTLYSLCADNYLQQVTDAVQGSSHDTAFRAVNLHIYFPPPAQPRQLNILLMLLGCRHLCRSLQLPYETCQPLCSTQ